MSYSDFDPRSEKYKAEQEAFVRGAEMQVKRLEQLERERPAVVDYSLVEERVAAEKARAERLAARKSAPRKSVRRGR